MDRELVRFCIVLLLAVGVSTASAQSGAIRLNSTLVTGGDVSTVGLGFTAGGDQVLYLADQDANDVFEIFLVPSRGGEPVRVNAPLVNDGDVFSARSSPDGTQLFYLADQETDGVVELFGAFTTSGWMPQRLNGSLAVDGDVFSEGVQFSPDGSRVLYLADQVTNDTVELFSVPSAGGTPIRLNDNLVAGGDVVATNLQFSPDGNRVFYLADQDANDVNELYSVNSTGGASVRLNGSLIAGGDVTNFLASPDSSRVLYLADQEVNDVSELYVVPSTGGTPLKLNDTLPVGGDVFSEGLQFSPDGGHVIYLADQDNNDVTELHSVPSLGGSPTRLNGTLATGGDVFAEGLQVTSDSSRVVYVADQDVNEVNELYSVPLDGGAPVKLNASLVADGDVLPEGVRLSPDGSRTLYVADQEVNNVSELFSVPTAGGTPVKLNGALVSGGDVFAENLLFSPDGERVLYAADQEANGVKEIFIVPSTGGTPIKLNAELTFGGDVQEAQFSPDGNRILYLADQETDNTTELFSRAVRLRFAAGGGNWNIAANWSEAVIPDEVTEVFIDPATNVVARGGLTERVVNRLHIGSADDTFLATATVNLEEGATIRSLHDVAITPGGVIQGDGRILGETTNADGGEVRSRTGERLVFTGESFLNAGRVEAIGSVLNRAELEFTGAFTNEANTGLIVARNAALRFSSGLNNAGSLAVSFGTTDVFGDITNEATGSIVVTGDGVATFFDDLVNQGTFQSSENSTVVFLGNVTGSGSFTGDGPIFFEGDLRPGNSAAEVNIRGDFHLGGQAELQIELGGLEQGTEFDTLNIEGAAILAGDLEVLLLNDFAPQAGDTFEILSATNGVQGEFNSVAFPELAEGLDWLFNYDSTNSRLLLEVVLALSADFDNDLDVDNADLLQLESSFGLDAAADADADGDTDGTDFLVFQRQFTGELNNSPTAATVVPEPPSWVLFALIGVRMLVSRHKIGLMT